jgi:DNA-binding NarL/FixJ family response regulator
MQPHTKANIMSKKNTTTEGTIAKKRIAIVDDHTMMREGLKQLIDNEPDLICSGLASNTSEAMKLAETQKPDMFTVDITMPGRNGLELIKDILAFCPGMPILVISMHDETLYAQRVLKAGAKGYVMKDADSGTLVKAIHQVIDGGIYVSPHMSAQILEAFSGRNANRPVDGVHRLSDREFEVFQLIGEGQSTQQIGDTLNISVKTVEVHRAHIREKLKLEDGAAVLRYAVRWAESRKLGV